MVEDFLEGVSDKLCLRPRRWLSSDKGTREYRSLFPEYAQCLYTDFGAYGNRVVPSRCTRRILRDKSSTSSMTLRSARCFVGEQLQYNNAFKVQKDSKYLERLVVFDPAVKMNPEDKTSIYFDDFLRLGDNGACGEAR